MFISFTAEEVNGHSYDVGGVLTLLPHHGPKIEGKVAYNGLLRNLLEKTLESDEPVEFSITDGFRS